MVMLAEGLKIFKAELPQNVQTVRLMIRYNLHVTSRRYVVPVRIYFLVSLLILAVSAELTVIRAQGRAMEVEDIMTFRKILDPDISRSGSLVSFEVSPDRGDGAVVVIDDHGEEQLRINRGTDPHLSGDDRWIKAHVHPPFQEPISNSVEDDSLVVIRTDRSDTLRFSGVKRAVISENSRWLVVLSSPETIGDEEDQANDKGERTKAGGRFALYSLDARSLLRDSSVGAPDEAGEKIQEGAGGQSPSDDDSRVNEPQQSGTDATLPEYQKRRHYFEADDVDEFTIDSLSTQVIYSIVDSTGEDNGLHMVDLAADSLTSRRIHRQKNAVYDGFSWHEPDRRLAFLFSREDDYGNPSPSALNVWDGEDEQLEQIIPANHFSGDRVLPLHSILTWSADGDRLFFGWQPYSMYHHSLYREEEQQFAVTDRDTILEGTEVDIWHGDDPLIKSHEKQTWQERRDHTYLVVYHFDRNQLVELADEQVPYVSPVDNDRYLLGRNPRPYRKSITWDGQYSDYYLIDLRDGSRREIVDRLRSTTISLSPGGRYVLFYEFGNWQLYDGDRNTIRNITESIDVSFADEDHDYPYPAPGYGMAGWVEGDRAVLVYDKFDIWQIDTRSDQALNLTGNQGRGQQKRFRVVPADPDKDSFQRNEHLLIRSFGERDKDYGFYGIRIGREGVERFVEGPYRYRFVAQSLAGDRLLYTRESYREFPDLWISDRRFRESEKLTRINPKISEFDWGEARLVRWRDLDGENLEGVLITPEDYREGDRLPVLVYFYEQFSQRLHHFNEQVINHRPGFPFYVSNGYAVFLPDVRYEIGIPGYSATRSIVPGVQKLIDMEVANPNAIGLHGHSWSGYQAAFMATQTDIFSAVVAGAPVSNMTSAYSGIRRGSGRARQFQYEQTQSRIGGSLWGKRDQYIENSPVFYADRIDTPMLIMFGDEDEAVPWEQGIEMYLAMRRLRKDVIFLQYRDEPHHPQKYANKLDYFLRMKEYLDHHLKGEPAADWIEEGVPYTGH